MRESSEETERKVKEYQQSEKADTVQDSACASDKAGEDKAVARQSFFGGLFCRKSGEVHYLFAGALITLIFFTVYNLAFRRHILKIYADSPQFDPLFKILLPTALFMLLFSYRYVFKFAFALLFLLTCEASYNAFAYGVIFDRSILLNIINTNTAEAFSYISWLSVAVFIFGGVLTCIVLLKLKLYYPKFTVSVLQRTAMIVLCLTVTSGIVLIRYQEFAFIFRNNRELKSEILPVGYILAAQSLIKRKYFSDPLPYVSLGDNAVHRAGTDDRPEAVFTVIGETARASDYSLLGYDRKTDEYTEAAGITTFKKVTSCGSATAYSVPCMFSDLSRNDYSEAKTESRDNLLDILRKAVRMLYGLIITPAAGAYAKT